MYDDMQDGRLRERRLPGVQSDVSASDSPVAPPDPKIHRRHNEGLAVWITGAASRVTVAGQPARHARPLESPHHSTDRQQPVQYRVI